MEKEDVVEIHLIFKGSGVDKAENLIRLMQQNESNVLPVEPVRTSLESKIPYERTESGACVECGFYSIFNASDGSLDENASHKPECSHYKEKQS